MPIIYLLKMIVCSAGVYALYALLFQREKMLVFNRFYLLGGLVVSFFIPFITITVPAPANRPITHSLSEVIFAEALPAQSSGLSVAGFVTYGMMGIFVLTSVYFLARFIVNYSKLRAIARHNDSFCIDDIRVVLLGNETVPHSFLKTVFLSKAEYEAGRVEAEVLEHELAHIRQKHSWDILWVELLQVFTWFNPMIYLYRRSIKINHELLADAAVVKYTGDVRSYQHVLLQRAVAQSPFALASSFNYYITKKRLIMLQKTFNKRKATKLSLLVIPLVSMLTFSFCNRVAKNDHPDEAKVTIDTLADPAQQNVALHDSDNAIPGKDSSGDGAPPPPKIEMRKFSPPKIIKDYSGGPGATAEEQAIYESIVKKMKVGENRYKTQNGNWGELLTIYKKMTIQQRTDASQLPPPPPPPPAPESERKKFTPPKIIKDDSVAVSFTPPRIVKDNEVHNIVKDAPVHEGTDNPLQRNF